MTQGLQYRLGKVADDGSVAVEVSETGRDDWHTLHTHKSLDAAADQIAALNESDAEHVTSSDFVKVVTQVLQAKPAQEHPPKGHKAKG